MEKRVPLSEHTLISAINAGKGIKHISADTGWSIAAISIFAKKHNIQFNQYKLMRKTGDWDTKEWLEHQYQNLKLSIGKIAKQVGVTNQIILRRMAEYKIALRNNTEANRMKAAEVSKISKQLWTKDAYRDKAIKNKKALWTNTEYRQKITDSSTTLWKNPTYRANASQRSKDLWNDDEYRTKCTAGAIKGHLANQNESKIQKHLYEILKEYNINFIPNHQIGPYEFDAFIEEHKLLIEVQGDYWHNIPKTISKDKAKATYINQYSEFEIMYIWEHEFKCPGKVNARIRHKLGLQSKNNIDITSTTYKIIPMKEAGEFCAKYHYLPSCPSNGLPIGFFFNDKLISLIVFSPCGRKETATRQGYKFNEVREISRICMADEYHIKNFGTYMISRAIKECKQRLPHVKLLISFSDDSMHQGTLYKAANFTNDGTVKADYWYKSEDGWVMHKKTLYNHARSLAITESEFAQKNNYTKVHGSAKTRWVYKLTS